MSLIRRVSGVLVILLSMLFLTTCTASQDAAGTQPVSPTVSPSRAGNPCTSGRGSDNRQAPIVCVDDSRRTLSVSPDPVRVHNVLRGDMRSPVMIHWWTQSGGGDLELEIADGCVTDLDCSRPGHCSARTLPGAGKSCKYDVWITGGNHDRLDPTIVIEPCCP